MKTFYEQFKDVAIEWVANLDEEQQNAVIKELLGDKYLSERGYNTPLEALEDKDADSWWWSNFAAHNRQYGSAVYYFDAAKVAGNILREACLDCEYTFADDFIYDIMDHMFDYDDPKDFFESLQYNGCVSGMIGMFVYHNDCKEFYIQHIDAMESFKQELEEGLGEPVRNMDHQPHYTFMCWLCYEEFCCRLYSELF